MRKRFWAVLVLIAAALAGCGKEPRGEQAAGKPGVAEAPSATVASESLRVLPYPGYAAPALEAVQVGSGAEVSLKGLRGKPVLLNVWATWCPPCKLEMPDLQKVHEALGQKVTVVAVGGDPGEEPEKLQAYFDEMGLTFASWYDPAGEVMRTFRVQGLPTSFFIDAEGVVRFRIAGAATYDQMVQGLKQAGADIP